MLTWNSLIYIFNLLLLLNYCKLKAAKLDILYFLNLKSYVLCKKKIQTKLPNVLTCQKEQNSKNYLSFRVMFDCIPSSCNTEII